MNRKSGPSSRPDKNRKPDRQDSAGRDNGGKKKFARKDDDSSYRSGAAGKTNFRKDDDRKPFRKDDGERKPFKRAGNSDERPSFRDRNNDKGSFGERSERPFKKREDRDDKPFRSRKDNDRPFSKKEDRPFNKRNDRDDKPFRERKEDRPFNKRNDRDDKPFRERGEDRPFNKRNDRDDKPFRERKDDRPFNMRNDRDDKPFRERKEDRPFKKREDNGDKPFRSKSSDTRPFRERTEDRPFKKREDRTDKPAREGADGKRDFKKRDDDKKYTSPGRMRAFEEQDLSFGKKHKVREAKPVDEQVDAQPTEDQQSETPAKPIRDIYEPLAISEEKKNNKKAPVIRKDPSRAVRKEDNQPIAAPRDNKPYYIKGEDGKPIRKRTYKESAEPTDEEREEAKRKQRAAAWQKSTDKKRKRFDDEDDDTDDDNEKASSMPLNKYLAHSGVCSRREAAELVKEGKVTVNDHIETNPAYKVADGDVIYYNEKKLTPQRDMVYILLNKPKDFITTNDDPQGRKTVMDLVANSGVERLFPVGRLDRNTTGLLLMTNDGELTQKLAHPSFKVKKIYQVTTDKPVTKADFDKIIDGLELEDGKATVDSLAYLEKKNELGIEIHIGRNRIVRRIFESLGYEVVKLDRVMYGALTKKNLPRGKWRFLNDKEIVLLKHFKS